MFEQIKEVELFNKNISAEIIITLIHQNDTH